MHTPALTLLAEHAIMQPTAAALMLQCRKVYQHLNWLRAAGNLPMFPRNLADDLFSLKLGRTTAALSVHMVLNPDGSLDIGGLVASTIRPSRQLTYQEVDELLDAALPEQEPVLWALNKVCSTNSVRKML